MRLAGCGVTFTFRARVLLSIIVKVYLYNVSVSSRYAMADRGFSLVRPI